MCAPLIVAGVGLAVSIGGMIMNAVGQKKAADAAEAEAARNQAEANRLAVTAENQGEYEVSTIRQKANQLIAAQANRTIGSGWSLNGTAERIIESTDLLSEQDVHIARMNAAQIALGYRKQGLAFASQADIIRQKSSNMMAGTILGAAGQATGGAASIWHYASAAAPASTSLNPNMPGDWGTSGGP